ncbi:MAG: D-2-hydroxyacid dehydrogenase [Candidatus Poribacteria bacterium]|nr:D-2-hydroxyacid dehydrogenase [Candidatus Poribacteria bacterium]
MSNPTILVRTGFYTEFEKRLKELAPNATFLTFEERDEMLEKLPHADALYGGSPREDVLDKCPRLKWLHMSSAGVNPQMAKEFGRRGITMTKGSGAYDIPIAEHVLAMMLAFSRGISHYIRQQPSHEWKRGMPLLQLSGKTLGIYGMGSIGGELARMCHALGMTVYGIARKPRPAPEYVEALWMTDKLDDLLRASDFLAVCAPLTDETRHTFGEREFGLMKPTSYIFNIGRGGTIVQDAMIDALRTGKIAGAGLDVTDPEPLPPDSPLWDMENVIITPHVSGGSDGTEARVTSIVLENIRRFAAGEPLMNVVDKELGY